MNTHLKPRILKHVVPVDTGKDLCKQTTEVMQFVLVNTYYVHDFVVQTVYTLNSFDKI